MHRFVFAQSRAWLMAILMLSDLAATPSSLAAIIALPRFHVDIRETSVSGLSSGAFMAVQFGVAYSSIVKGVGVIAGGPYYCAQGDVEIATSKCSCTGFFIFSSCEVAPGATRVSQLIAITDRDAAQGSIDPTSNMARQRIWMFSGTLDSVVPMPVMNDLLAYYRHYISDGNIRYRNDVRAEHAMPTDAFGNHCDKLGSPYINNCNVDAAGELLRWIYGDTLQARRVGPLAGRLIHFDQSEFVDGRNPERHGLATSGFAFVPAGCEGTAAVLCKLHIAFHGCQQNFDSVGDRFVKHAGYNPWADTNRIIVLYPQTAASAGTNPNGCWNWFDYDHLDPDYAKKSGVQMQAIKRMIDRIAGLTAPPSKPACFTASNADHVAAGRAYDWFFLARAKGSNAFMGLDNAFWITTLKRIAPDSYDIGTCS
jgi:poly(3-hydroxybutyrate) depolymerase